MTNTVVPTPPAIWSCFADWKRTGVLPSPRPVITREGWTVTMTGVRYTHMHHCPRYQCRLAIYTSTEGGTIQLGFRDSGNSFETYTAGAKPVFTGDCPHCGLDLGQLGEDRYPNPAPDAYARVRPEWERLRRHLQV